jgi:adenylate cyclase
MDGPPQQFPLETRAEDAADRLDSWKEIAAFLRRNVRTVQRWEARNGLPVYRHCPEPIKGSPVHAYRSELDAWLRTYGRAAAHDGSVPPDTSAAPVAPTGRLVLASRTGAMERAAPDAEWTGLGTTDAIAYAEYVRGRRYLEDFRNSDETEKARTHLERALARDPEFALAGEALAQLHWFTGYLGLVEPRKAFADAVLHAVRVLEIDNARAETHALLAQIRKQVDYTWSDIERVHKRALDLDPLSPFAHFMFGFGYLMPQGRLDEGITTLEQVLQRDPLAKWVNNGLGVLLVLARDWDRALALARLVAELDPNSPWGHWLLGISLRGKGLAAEALAAHARAVDLSGGWPFLLGWFGLLLGASGKTTEAREVLARLHAARRTRYVPASSVAWVHLGLGEVDAAFEWLDRAIDEHDQLMMPIKSYAFFDPIRPDPRFAALLRKMHLSE